VRPRAPVQAVPFSAAGLFSSGLVVLEAIRSVRVAPQALPAVPQDAAPCTPHAPRLAELPAAVQALARVPVVPVDVQALAHAPVVRAPAD
jgi:hypothetical protein